MLKFVRWFKLYARDDSGSVAVITALSAVALIGMVGAAVDYARVINAQSRTTAALDAALLVGGRTLQTDPDGTAEALAAAELYFNQQAERGLPIDDVQVTFTLEDNDTTISGRAVAKIFTPFMSVVGTPSLPIIADSKATLAIGSSKGTSNLEISMMLDTTGSMCDDGNGPCTRGTKIDALKSAANDLVDIIIHDENRQEARISVVPFSTRIRLGTGDADGYALMKRTTNLGSEWSGYTEVCTQFSGGSGSSGSSEHNTSSGATCTKSEVRKFDGWKLFPCVVDRTGPEAFTDAAPGPNAWLNAHDAGRWPLSYDSSETPITSKLGKTPSDPAVQWNYGDTAGDYCADVANSNVLMPLTSKKTDIKNRIDSLSAYGATSGALGTAWSWYTLSPKWSNVWDSKARPRNYNELKQSNPGGAPKLRKIAVLMTDGDYNTYRGWKDYDVNIVASNARAICANMKAQGIEIYTVGFNLDELPADARSRARQTLEQCGTDLSHFYDALDEEKLRISFRDIALKLSKLVLKE